MVVSSNTREYNRLYYQQNKARSSESNRKYHLKKTYGIEPEIYDSFFEYQRGRCAICNKHQSELRKKLFIDHDHITGIIRGLLCYRCNSLLGLSNDSILLLEKSISYLKERSE